MLGEGECVCVFACVIFFACGVRNPCVCPRRRTDANAIFFSHLHSHSHTHSHSHSHTKQTTYTGKPHTQKHTQEHAQKKQNTHSYRLAATNETSLVGHFLAIVPPFYTLCDRMHLAHLAVTQHPRHMQCDFADAHMDIFLAHISKPNQQLAVGTRAFHAQFTRISRAFQTRNGHQDRHY